MFIFAGTIANQLLNLFLTELYPRVNIFKMKMNENFEYGNRGTHSDI